MKTFYIFALSLLLGNSGFAQEEIETTSREAKKKVVPGLKLGLVRANAYARSGTGFGSSEVSGFCAGGFIALPIGSLLGIQPELLFLQKGLRGHAMMNGERYSFTRTTSHIDIPIQGQLKLFKWLTFLVGPQYSVLLGQQEHYSFGGNTTMRDEFELDESRQGLWGVLSGFDINLRHVVFSFRSGWDITPSYDYNSGVTPRYRNRWTQFTLGYRFY